MSSGCPAGIRLAAFASRDGDVDLDSDVRAHLGGCSPCRELVAEQRSVRALAASLVPPPALTRAHREALAAEVMARADHLGPGDIPRDAGDEERAADELARRRRRVSGAIFATTLAAAAAIVVVALTGARDSSSERASRDLGSSPSNASNPTASSEPASAATPDDPATPTVSSATLPQQPAGVTGAKAQFSRETTPSNDTVRLRDGELAIDALATRAVDIVAGSTRIAIPTSTKATVVARQGVIESVAVFAGSVEVIAGDRKATIAAGAVWERTTLTAAPGDKAASTDRLDREAAGASAPASDGQAAALQAFRDGWTALRAGDHRAAIAAFDRATDPVVAEDAAYWAAIATERAGDRADAAKRHADFVARFPASPRAAAARTALERLGAR